MDRLERRPENGSEVSCNGSSDYAASTPSSIEKNYPNQMQQIDEFMHKKETKSITMI